MEIKNLTFAMIKPDAITAKHSGKIIDIIEHNGFEIMRLQKAILSVELAKIFYDVHKERPFFEELVSFVTSGPVIIMALYKENAVEDWRTLIGVTDPAKAAQGTIRQQFGTSIDKNAVHGSDSAQTALEELDLFFPDLFEYREPEESTECCEDENECTGAC